MSFPRYPIYKDSGVEWLGQVPEHWDVKPNKAFLKMLKSEVGETWSEKTLLSLTLNGVIPRDVEGGGKFPAEFNAYQDVAENDIVFCLFDIDETPRTVGLAQAPGMITSAYDVFRCNAQANPKFVVYYYLHIDAFKGLRPFYTGLRKVVRPPTFMAVKIPLPPLPEQTRIAAFLDQETAKIDALVTEQERLMELLKEKRQAVISHVVTKGLNPQAALKPSGIEWLGDVPAHWELQRVKYLTQILRGKFTHRPRSDPKMYDGPYPFIQTGEISSESRYVGEYYQTLSEAGFEVSKQFPKGTLVMTITGAGTANVAILNYEACFPDSIVGFVPKHGVSIEYLYNLFIAMREVLLSTSVTNTQPNLNIERIGALMTVNPPLEEQEAIVERIDKVSGTYAEMAAEAQRAIDLLQERRTAVISAAVTGQIDVRQT